MIGNYEIEKKTPTLRTHRIHCGPNTTIKTFKLFCFHAPSRPQKMDKFLFFSYRNTYKIRHYKKDNGNPTIDYFIYEFHSNRNTCPTETKFVSVDLRDEEKGTMASIKSLSNTPFQHVGTMDQLRILNSSSITLHLCTFLHYRD
jgi:hypothetical protein